MKRSIIAFLGSFTLLLVFAAGATAQEKTHFGRIPDEVYYLMPQFGNGTVYLRGQRPVDGRLNICAVDNTLRFIGPDGNELTATQDGDIVKVRIDSVMFLRDQKIFYRMVPFNQEMGVAVQRDVRIFQDAKEGAYGSVSQTSSIQEYGVLYADGVVHDLNRQKEYPYKVSEICCIYKENQVFPLTKKNLRKLFPARKDEIDAFFKSGAKLPDTPAEALDFLARWAE